LDALVANTTSGLPASVSCFGGGLRL